MGGGQRGSSLDKTVLKSSWRDWASYFSVLNGGKPPKNKNKKKKRLVEQEAWQAGRGGGCHCRRTAWQQSFLVLYPKLCTIWAWSGKIRRSPGNFLQTRHLIISKPPPQEEKKKKAKNLNQMIHTLKNESAFGTRTVFCSWKAATICYSNKVFPSSKQK